MRKIYQEKNSKRINLLLILLLCIAFDINAQLNLPNYLYSAPSPAPTAPGTAFSPVMSGSALANTPQCAEWTRTAGPDESVVITGLDFTRFDGLDEGKDTRFKVYTTNGFAKDASIQRLEKDKVMITLDKNLQSWGMYLIWPGNDAGLGKPIAINKTDAWWIGPNRAVAGGTSSVFGRNLSSTNDSTGDSHIYIKTTSGEPQKLTVTKVNPYKVDFVIPPDLAVGDYEIWAHNGHGHQYGWSGPLALTIKSPTVWSQDTVDVKADFGALGDGIADDTDAINNAIAAAGSSFRTLYFPSGTYMIRTLLSPKSNTRWVGASKNNTHIKCGSNFSLAAEAMIFGYDINNLQVSNLSFHTNNYYKGIQPQVFAIALGSEIKLDSLNFFTENFAALRLSGTKRLFITNCEFFGGKDSTASSYFSGNTQLFIDKCTFHMANDMDNAFKTLQVSEFSLTNSIGKDLNNTIPGGWGRRFYQSAGNNPSEWYCCHLFK